MAVSQLRIRIPPRTLEEEVGEEFNAFGYLCQFIKPTESCGTCQISHEDACSMCLAMALKNPKAVGYGLARQMHHYSHWFKILLERKENLTK